MSLYVGFTFLSIVSCLCVLSCPPPSARPHPVIVQNSFTCLWLSTCASALLTWAPSSPAVDRSLCLHTTYLWLPAVLPFVFHYFFKLFLRSCCALLLFRNSLFDLIPPFTPPCWPRVCLRSVKPDKAIPETSTWFPFSPPLFCSVIPLRSSLS